MTTTTTMMMMMMMMMMTMMMIPWRTHHVIVGDVQEADVVIGRLGRRLLIEGHLIADGPRHRHVPILVRVAAVRVRGLHHNLQ
jgi:hypothetical protein